MNIGDRVATLFLGGILGVLIGLACANHPQQYQPEQCTTLPTGKQNTEVFETNLDGMKMQAERVVGREWAVICMRTEWR